MPLTLAFLNFGMGEMLLLAIVALLLYGSDLRISQDLPAGSLASGEVAAAIGLFLLAAGSIMALAANIPEPAPVPHRTGKASL